MFSFASSLVRPYLPRLVLTRTVLVTLLIAPLALNLHASPGQAADPQAPASPASSSTSSSAQDTPQQQAPAPKTSSPTSVAARIKARREQRRAAAIHDVYSHLYEVNIGGGFTRTSPGPGAVSGAGLQKVNLYSWDVGIARYYDERFGVVIDARGAYGTAYLGNNPYSLTHPAISEYSGMIGPTYRFLIQPRYSISGRVMGGIGYGNFSSDTNGFGTKVLGLYPDGIAAAVSASVPLEYNVSPGLGLRLAPEYRLTTFGSSIQNGYGFTAGVVYRWGKQ